MTNCEEALKDSMINHPSNFKPVKTTTREKVINIAKSLISGDRQGQYGPPEDNFGNIADLWNTRFKYLLGEEKEFKPSDVAVAMSLVKIARDMSFGYKEDSAIDGIGYLALYAELAEMEEKL